MAFKISASELFSGDRKPEGKLLGIDRTRPHQREAAAKVGVCKCRRGAISCVSSSAYRLFFMGLSETESVTGVLFSFFAAARCAFHSLIARRLVQSPC